MSAAYVCVRCSRRAASGALTLGRHNGSGAAAAGGALSAAAWPYPAPLSRRARLQSTASARINDTTNPPTPSVVQDEAIAAPSEATELSGASRAADGPAVSTINPPPSVLPPRSKHRATPPWHAHQIHDLVTPDRSALEIWHRTMALHAFRASSLPESLEIGLRRSPEMRRAFRLFVYTALQRAPPPDFPSLEAVLRRFLERGLFRYQMLADVLQEARPELATAVFGGDNIKTPEEAESAAARAIELLRHILTAWRLTLGASPARTLLAGPSDAAADWEGLPSPEEVQQLVRPEGNSYMTLFRELFGGRLDVRVEERVAADSAWVFVCFEELRQQGRIAEASPDREAWKPWTELMWRLLWRTKASKNRRSHVRNILMAGTNPAPAATLRAALDSWHQVAPDTSTSEAPKPYPHYQNASAVPVKRQGKAPFDGSAEARAWRSQIWRAVEQKDERRLLAHWLRFKESSTDWESRADVAALLGEFLWAGVRMHLRDLTVGVWHFLQEADGVTPSLTHWTAVLEAAKRGGDRAAVAQIWATIHRTGYRPPNQLWTTYIGALLRLRDSTAALQAVHAMGEQWRAARTMTATTAAATAAAAAAVQAGTGPGEGESKVEGTSEPAELPAAEYAPSMIPLNATVSGLIEMERPEPVPTVLATAEAHGLVPTVDTYNILLRAAVRRNDAAGIRTVLGEMKSAGVAPDVITFTIYIDGLVKDPASPFAAGGSAADAQAAVEHVFADLAAVGLQPSPLTYTTLLHNLLGGATPNVPAAQAVLHQMAAQGLHHSSHAYTILAAHYFGRDPPDLGAVERLRARIAADGTQLDLRFYDGLVQGYARAGQRDAMLAVLRRLADASQLRLWTLNDALALCVADADADSARALLLHSLRKLRAAGLSKGERQEIPRWRDLAAQLKRDGVINHMPQPVPFRKVNTLEQTASV